eukprot:15549417-Heterocapsa_arctica.AAC.1
MSRTRGKRQCCPEITFHVPTRMAKPNRGQAKELAGRTCDRQGRGANWRKKTSPKTRAFARCQN